MTRKTKTEPPCQCHEHVDSAPTEVEGHVYALEQEDESPGRGWWRWYCRTCKQAGRWQGQSPWVSYHAWLTNHVYRRVRRDR